MDRSGRKRKIIIEHLKCESKRGNTGAKGSMRVCSGAGAGRESIKPKFKGQCSKPTHYFMN